jgi:hypothetical protein
MLMLCNPKFKMSIFYSLNIRIGHSKAVLNETLNMEH